MRCLLRESGWNALGVFLSWTPDVVTLPVKVWKGKCTKKHGWLATSQKHLQNDFHYSGWPEMHCLVTPRKAKAKKRPVRSVFN